MEQTKEIGRQGDGVFCDSLTIFICHDRIVNVGKPVGVLDRIKAEGETERKRNSRESLTFY